MRVTIAIEDNQAPFLLGLLKQLNYVSIIQSNDYVIPEEHKQLVLERIKTSKPEDYIPWDEARKKLKFK